MKKNEILNQWLWKWHVIAGLISLPFVLILAITGGIYLFKDKVEAPYIEQLQKVTIEKSSIPYNKQLNIASKQLKTKPNSMIFPLIEGKSVEFISGKFSHKNSVFINPYTGEVTGTFSPKNTWMYTIRKLHGELLNGKIGTKLIELIASWMIVLILSGIYVFWPAKEGGIKGFFRIRTQLGKRIFFRDLHSVAGFWISLLLLLTLAGGLPWTDVFGSGFKEIQKITNTGFPKEWFGIGVNSNSIGNPISIDEMVTIAKNQQLNGQIIIDFPKHKKGVFSVSNTTFPLKNQQKIHFDQYTGRKLMSLQWSDVGFLMRGRMWVMAFHQGQLGKWNFIVMLGVSFILTLISFSGLFSYLYRKPKNSWAIPKAPENFKVGYAVLTSIILLGLLLPLFGLSIFFIWILSLIQKQQKIF